MFSLLFYFTCKAEIFVEGFVGLGGYFHNIHIAAEEEERKGLHFEILGGSHEGHIHGVVYNAVGVGIMGNTNTEFADITIIGGMDFVFGASRRGVISVSAVVGEEKAVEFVVAKDDV